MRCKESSAKILRCKLTKDCYLEYSSNCKRIEFALTTTGIFTLYRPHRLQLIFMSFNRLSGSLPKLSVHLWKKESLRVYGRELVIRIGFFFLNFAVAPSFWTSLRNASRGRLMLIAILHAALLRTAPYRCTELVPEAQQMIRNGSFCRSRPCVSRPIFTLPSRVLAFIPFVVIIKLSYEALTQVLLCPPSGPSTQSTLQGAKRRKLVEERLFQRVPTASWAILSHLIPLPIAARTRTGRLSVGKTVEKTLLMFKDSGRYLTCIPVLRQRKEFSQLSSGTLRIEKNPFLVP